MQNSEEIWRRVDDKKEEFIALADRVWDMPELCYTETKSCAEHISMLEQQGFRITKNVADIPTAIIGEAGEDGPVIAILGEYDALPGLSQEPASPSPGRLRATTTATAAATTCSDPRRCSPRPR